MQGKYRSSGIVKLNRSGSLGGKCLALRALKAEGESVISSKLARSFSISTHDTYSNVDEDSTLRMDHCHNDFVDYESEQESEG